MPILSRKRDLAYLVFFLIHLPVMFYVDLAPLYPSSIRPALVTRIRTYYIDTFHDQFFTHPPAWFNMYIWLELVYHVPLSVWAIGALVRNDPRLPIHLLIYSVQTAITTATCIADFLSWSVTSDAEKLGLAKLYVPYLALSVFMGVDMFTRLVAAVNRGQVARPKKTQ